MKMSNLPIIMLFFISSSVMAQSVPSVSSSSCPCDFSSQSFGQLLGNFSQGSVSCSMQSGLKVIDVGGKPDVVNTLSARALVLSKESFTPKAWLIEYYSAENKPQYGMGSFCATAMTASINASERKQITTFAQYQSCLRDFVAALKTIKVECNQLDANLPDPPKNVAPASSPTTIEGIMNAIPLKVMPPQDFQSQPVMRDAGSSANAQPASDIISVAAQRYHMAAKANQYLTATLTQIQVISVAAESLKGSKMAITQQEIAKYMQNDNQSMTTEYGANVTVVPSTDNSSIRISYDKMPQDVCELVTARLQGNKSYAVQGGCDGKFAVLYKLN